MESTNSVLTVCHYQQIWLNLTENWIYNQIKCLPNSIENHILCEVTQNLDQFPISNIHSFSEAPDLSRLVDLSLRKLKFCNHLGFLNRVSKEIQANILHSHYGPRAWENLTIAKRNRMKHVVTFYGYDVNFMPRRYPQWLERYQALFQSVDKILCEGSYMAQCIVELGCPAEKVQVHHLGVLLEHIPFRPRTWNLGEPLKILIAASFREKKGIPYAIEALGRFQHEQPVEITIVGGATPDERSQNEKKKILTLIEANNLSSKVSFLGFQPHNILIEEAYKNHVFLSPSITSTHGDTEGGAPVAIIEMIATGMPVISTKHCDIPEVANNSGKVLLAEERDVDGLVEHLRWLINNPHRWQKILEIGRQHIEKEYSAQIQGKKLAEIYLNL